MSDVEIPIYVARAQVASAIHLVVQLSRFSEDGSRRITRITEACGLGEDGFILRDLFLSRMRGKTADGMLIADLEATGQIPTFAGEVHEQGLEGSIRLTTDLWRP
jgi:pilus assembly protein CpaF